ncbi:MAG: glycosyltransferase involved in cell wall biosynthesis [Planctomycetota bacterium]|jgi:glycosyltransferase involved in cell wall biosynthesis
MGRVHLKIALVTPGFNPGNFGLVETVVESHARALAGLGHEVRVVTGGLEPEAEDLWHNEIMAGLDVRRLDLSLGARSDSGPWVEAVGDVDVCHVQHTSELPMDLVRTLARRLPVAMTQFDFFPSCASYFRQPGVGQEECIETRGLESGHSACEPSVISGSTEPSGPLARNLQDRRSEAQAEIDAARLVIFPSRTHLVRLADHLILDPAHTRILAPGLCKDFSSSVVRPAPWLGQGPLRVLHFGRRSRDRGSLDLVRALAPLADREIELICMGPEAHEGVDSELLELRGNLRVRILGKFDARSLQRIARTCHVAAFPNRHPSGYSLAIDEALAMGLPVMASECGAATERFGHGPVQSLPAADIPAWTQAFQQLLKQPDRLTQAFVALPESVTSATEVAERLEQHYRRILQGAAARRAS